MQITNVLIKEVKPVKLAENLHITIKNGTFRS